MRDYALLVKFRLSLTVVMSAVLGYAIAATGSIGGWSMVLLGLGGFLVTGAANAANEILEYRFDAIMNRTKDRPIAAGRMSRLEALVFTVIALGAGTYILATWFNALAAVIGLISFASYAFLYTPLKRLTPFSVLVGAFPGALPPTIGVVAATGYFSIEACLLFSLQFFWQFPHFWAIAWLGAEDYKRAGYKMTIRSKGPDLLMAFYVLIYTLMLIPLGTLPTFYGMATQGALVVNTLLGIGFAVPAIELLRKPGRKAAKHVMFASFLYLPLLLTSLLIFKA